MDISKVVHGYPWLFMVIHGYSGLFMGFVAPDYRVAVHGSSRRVGRSRSSCQQMLPASCDHFMKDT